MMKYSAARLPKWANQYHSSIDIMVTFEGHGEVPFTASPNDIEEHGRDIFARAAAGEFGAVAPYSPTLAVPVAVSMRQARLALLQAGLLDDVEGVIASMEGDAGRAARIEWEYAAEVRRDASLIAAVQSAAGINGDQIDQLFVTASEL